MTPAAQRSSTLVVSIPAASVALPGVLEVPDDALGVVIFGNVRQSSRTSRVRQYIVRTLHTRGLATLMVDLFAHEEQSTQLGPGHPPPDGKLPDGKLVAARLIAVSEWLGLQPETACCRIGYFDGGSLGDGALLAAAQRPDLVRTIVTTGGWPDLADAVHSLPQPPVLLLPEVPDLVRGRDALERLADEVCSWLHCLLVTATARRSSPD